MNLVEAGRTLKHLRLSGMAEHLEIRILEAQTSRISSLCCTTQFCGPAWSAAGQIQCPGNA